MSEPIEIEIDTLVLRGTSEQSVADLVDALGAELARYVVENVSHRDRAASAEIRVSALRVASGPESSAVEQGTAIASAVLGGLSR